MRPPNNNRQYISVDKIQSKSGRGKKDYLISETHAYIRIFFTKIFDKYKNTYGKCSRK